MGGDGAITHELSDRLAEDLMNERFEALVSYLDNPHPYLTTEWVSAMFRLRDKEISSGRKLFTPDMYAFAARQSKSMQELDWIGGYDTKEIFDGKPRQLFEAARRMYYSHSGIHSMYHRRDRLTAAAEIFSYRLEFLSHQDGLLARETANIHEELAFYDMLEGNTGQYLSKARQLNEMVVGGETPWIYPFKMHALMSLFDLEANQLLAETKQPEAKASRYHGLKKIHIGLNTALVFFAEQIHDYADYADEEIAQIKDDKLRELAREQAVSRGSGMVGVLTEALAMSVVQNHILDSGLHKKYWVRQAFLREDSMADRNLRKSRRANVLNVPNLSFDLQIYDHTSVQGNNVPIEVKKPKKKVRDSLHPDIEVIMFEDRKDSRSFADTVKKFAQGQIAKHEGGGLTTREKKMQRIIHNRVDPVRLFKQL